MNKLEAIKQIQDLHQQGQLNDITALTWAKLIVDTPEGEMLDLLLNWAEQK